MLQWICQQFKIHENAMDYDCYTPHCAKLQQIPLLLHDSVSKSLKSEMVLHPCDIQEP